ncbi:MAG TPA: DUF1800 family protein [Gaiellales bacterium]|nr:DUF1800 family protein [Gaiellales bacterium]
MTLQYPKVPSVQTRPHFKRLLWRAGFFGNRAHLDHYVNKGLGHAVQELLAPYRTNVLVGPTPKVNNQPIAPLDEWGHDCLWWLDRMVRSRNQLVERMTLNLHDLFATSNSGVGNTRHMLRQNRLLRSYSLGNFATLLQEITHDPAMLLWLNGADSTSGEPNENYAREVMELFCLGNDPGLEDATYGLWTNANMYTQTDIHEAARALTGWRYDWNKAANGTLAERENPTYYSTASWAHDAGQKRIFGHTGNYNWQDVCSLVIHHPNHAPYLCYSLWNYFHAVPPPEDAMQMMVNNYKASGHLLGPVLGVILRHHKMWENLDAPDLVKPPIVFVASGLRAQDKFITQNSWSWILEGMGQVPFYPPNVSGWKQGPGFLNTNTVRAYWTAADNLLGYQPPDPGTQTPTQAVTGAIAALGGPWVSLDSRTKLLTYATTYETRHAPLDLHDRTERQKALQGLLMAGPDGLLH